MLLLDATCCPSDIAYPEKVLADKIYRHRKTLSYCKDKGIRITGPTLGRPKKDSNVAKEAKRAEYKDICERNAVKVKIILRS